MILIKFLIYRKQFWFLFKPAKYFWRAASELLLKPAVRSCSEKRFPDFEIAVDLQQRFRIILDLKKPRRHMCTVYYNLDNSESMIRIYIIN